jgi:hypothetical protein
MEFWGPFCFGLVIGWVTYRTLRRKADGVALGDLASVIGAVGGAAIVALFKNAAFDSYCIGLAVGFFAYFIIGAIAEKLAAGKKTASGGEKPVSAWMESRDTQ